MGDKCRIGDCRTNLRVDVTFCRLSKLLGFASYSYFKSERLRLIIPFECVEDGLARGDCQLS